jgi:class 3 adenylate cyclase
MRFGPPVSFARRRDGRHLAYQVVGEGELDLVFLLGWPTHLGLLWEHPSVAEFLGRLSSFSRLILVDSTSRTAELGDRRWHRLLEGHQQVVRRQLARFRGREVKTTGDGFLATFDGPARAIRAADAIRAELRELGLEVRVGLHTGECELLGEDIGGIAVHIAARVLAQAGAGEIWCSRTVKDLVAGAGFAFADRGTHRLKGVPEPWQLFAVELAARWPVTQP